MMTDLDITPEEAIQALEAGSYDRLRAEHMGWRFDKPTVVRFKDIGWDVRIGFKCVCGRQELFRHLVPSLYVMRGFDLARNLRERGSLTRPHLREDGYTEEQIAEIERRGEEFDRITREHWEQHWMRRGVRLPRDGEPFIGG